ncbi:hypothetical protein M501DRAFT_978563 [Patellaria atrata CBS 101060]|uniref:Transcription factor CBF/NF-Y/archaeal histone domain-containing protein n=1 Tax=Patellaria atrata CBS 101060 TaxID=1346257 RepID=A0A9P4S7X0_9PEZI|nr:hypothetical protein M501DRAFT_978563 [Patellaria atrata CBS 101060]
MAPATTHYPRATVKRIVKAHTNRPLSKNADIAIWLDYTLFLQDLLRKAAITSKQAGEKGVSAKSIRKVRENSLRKFKG